LADQHQDRGRAGMNGHWIFAVPLTLVIAIAFASGVAWRAGIQNGDDIKTLAAAQIKLTDTLTVITTRQAINMDRIERVMKLIEARAEDGPRTVR